MGGMLNTGMDYWGGLEKRNSLASLDKFNLARRQGFSLRPLKIDPEPRIW